jgi:hypothetical protein
MWRTAGVPHSRCAAQPVCRTAGVTTIETRFLSLTDRSLLIAPTELSQLCIHSRMKQEMTFEQTFTTWGYELQR